MKKITYIGVSIAILGIAYTPLYAVETVRENGTTQVLKEKVLLMGGSTYSQSLFNDVWSSISMDNWINLVPNNTTKNMWRPRNFVTSLYFRDKVYAISGQGNSQNVGPEMWSTSDGNRWSRLPDLPWSSDLYEHNLDKTYVVYNQKIWALGGANHDPAKGGMRYLNDVWSFDGISWKKEANAPWPGRSLAGAAVYKSKLWLMGGYIDAAITSSDVWSFDGTYWKQESSLPYGLAFQNGHKPLAPFQDKLWIMGNYQYSYNTVLSFDGVTWSESRAPWSNRANHTNLIANDHIYVYGGIQAKPDGSVFLNDVWSFDGNIWSELPIGSWKPRAYYDGVVVPIDFGTSVFDTNAQFGSSGKKVIDIQNRLVELGFLKPQYVTGYFGNITLGAVCQFQVENHLSSDENQSCGTFGPKTRAIFNSK